jgi:hypothetical protein
VTVTSRTFAAIGAPKGHARCEIERTEVESLTLDVVTTSVRVRFYCECRRRFHLRDELTAHHNLEALLLASTIIASGKP